jgi:XTP/dITP diphosphohydrolase
MVKEIFLATKNIGKLSEFKSMLKDLVRVRSVYEIIDEHICVKEDGSTLEENATIKAVSFSKLLDGLIVADDSGLFVNLLNGRPGVFSSRYAGENASDRDNIDKLLSELEGIPFDKRQASFRCVIAAAYKGKLLKIFKGEVQGFIGEVIRGESGFGYDPIFYIDKQKSFAEIGEEQKNQMSHRFIAIEKLKEFLRAYNHDK